jgi:hypothetical protein
MDTKGRRQSKNVVGRELAPLVGASQSLRQPIVKFVPLNGEQLDAFDKAKSLGLDKALKAMPDAVKRDMQMRAERQKAERTKTSRNPTKREQQKRK